MSTVTSRNPRQVMSLKDVSKTSQRVRSRSAGVSTRSRDRTSVLNSDAAELKMSIGDGGGSSSNNDGGNDYDSSGDNPEEEGDSSPGPVDRGAARGGNLDTGRVSNPTIANEKETFKLADLLKGIEQLTGEENFDAWYETIMDLQYGRGWPMHYFDQLATPWNGETDNSNLRKEIYCCLQMSIGKNLKYLMTGIRRGDVNRLWRVINNKFRHKSTQSVGDLIADFWQLRMDNLGLNVDMFGSYVRKKGDIIANMGERITETQMSTVFLRGLLPEFHTIATQFCNCGMTTYTTMTTL